MQHQAFAIAILLLSCAAEATGDSFSGCWPITPADAVPLHPPTFAQYRVAASFRGPVATVNLASHPRANTFRTMLRKGVKRGPNFAGHYTIVGWGCGTSCLDFAIVDAVSGVVYFPSFGPVSSVRVASMPGERDPDYWSLRYRIDSSLLVVLGAPGDDEDKEGITYYRWDEKELILVRHLKSLKDKDC